MKRLTFTEAQQIYPHVDRAALIATARDAGSTVADDAEIWFEEYTADEMGGKSGARLGHISAFVTTTDG